MALDLGAFVDRSEVFWEGGWKVAFAREMGLGIFFVVFICFLYIYTVYTHFFLKSSLKKSMIEFDEFTWGLTKVMWSNFQ